VFVEQAGLAQIDSLAAHALEKPAGLKAFCMAAQARLTPKLDKV